MNIRRDSKGVKHPWYFYWLPVLMLVFVLGIGAAGYLLANHQDEIDQAERETVILCEAQNENRQILFGVLEHLAEPQEGDEPGDYERRQELLEHFRGELAPRPCPPVPEVESL